MAKLENTSIEELREKLAEVDDPKATKRLMLAILYKQGPSVPMIAEWYDMRAETIYSWFTQIEEDPLDEAIFDDPPPGRPPKLTEVQRKQFKKSLHQPPEQIGYDAPAWTRPLAEQFLEEEFDVTYHERHVRRLMNELGVSWQTPRPRPPTADKEERTAVSEDIKKTQ